jgi:hypothetical protein
LNTPADQIKAAQRIVDAKREHGKTARLQPLGPNGRRQFNSRRSKAQINEMVAKMLARGITGLGPRMGAWCAGYISNAEFERDIETAAQINEANGNV